MLLPVLTLHSYRRPHNSPSYGCVDLVFHSSTDGYLGDIVSGPAMYDDLGPSVCLSPHSLGAPKSGTAEPHGNFNFNFLRNFPNQHSV